MRPTNQQWTIDASHSNIEFAVRHLMISTVRGRFTEVTGAIELDPDVPSEGRGEITIPVASIDTGEANRDQHLRSPDFFDAETHPTMIYRTRRVEPLRGGKLRVVGDLTIRGVTKEVPLTVERGGAARDPWGNFRVAYAASATLNRTDFGLTWNKALETGGVLVGDEIKISVEVQLVRQAEQAAA